jgi:hypothetical protein
MVHFFNFIFACILLLSLTQKATSLFPRVSLSNVEIIRNRPLFSFKAFLNTSWQKQFEEWYLHQSGFFGTLVKTGNSINYHLFQSTNPNYQTDNATLIGAKHALFDKIYCNDLNGKYIVSLSEDELKIRALKKLQKYLQERNIQFLLLIHPNKAVFNPEWVSDDLKMREPKTRTVERLVPLLKANGINVLNLEDELLTTKELFPKSGAHLNSFGKCLSAAATSSYLNENLKTSAAHRGIPIFQCIKNGLYSKSKNADLDLINLLNVWNTAKSRTMVPQFVVEYTSKLNNTFNKNESTSLPHREELRRPSLLIIGTSYVFGLLKAFDSVKAFSSTDFIFYSTSHYFSRNRYTNLEKRGKKKFSNELYELDFVKKHDIVILESTSARLHQLGFGFLEEIDKVL